MEDVQPPNVPIDQQTRGGRSALTNRGEPRRRLLDDRHGPRTVLPCRIASGLHLIQFGVILNHIPRVPPAIDGRCSASGEENYDVISEDIGHEGASLHRRRTAFGRIHLLVDAYVAVLQEIRCNPFYWCGTPVLQDKHEAMVEACRRSFGLGYHGNADARLLTLVETAMERGWAMYVEQVRPKVNAEAIAALFDDDGNVKPDAIDKLGEKFQECLGSLSPTLIRSQSVMNLREEAMAEALEQAFGIETLGGPPRHIRDERLRLLADAVLAKYGF